jgi:hypothetical protein
MVQGRDWVIRLWGHAARHAFTLLAVVGCAHGAAIREPTQATSEHDVEHVLRTMLAIPDSEPVLISRSYAPLYFPRATFYQAAYSEPGRWHSPASTAAVASIDGELVPARRVDDTPQVWKRAIVDTSLQDFEVQMACATLLVQLGFLKPSARFIDGPGEIPDAQREWLEPASALDEVQGPLMLRTGAGVGAQFYVWSGDLLRLRCVGRGRVLQMSMDTIAKRPADEP